MDTKKVTLSFIAITLSLALLQFSLAPIAIAKHDQNQPLPETIAGTVIPSQSNENSNEPTYTGGFYIYGIAASDGEFTGKISYIFYLDGDLALATVQTDIDGTYKFAKHGLMIQFSGVGQSGPFKSSLRQDARYSVLAPGSMIGYINTPGNGYVTQVFIAGCLDPENPNLPICLLPLLGI